MTVRFVFCFSFKAVSYTHLRELLKHEKILEYTSIYEEYLEKNDGKKTWLVNTHKLVRFYDGVDGLKTGYTTMAGYCPVSYTHLDVYKRQLYSY